MKRKTIKINIEATLSYEINEFDDLKYAIQDIEEKVESLQEHGETKISINISDRKK